MARVLKREAAKRDLMAQWVWYAENADIEITDRFLRAAHRTLHFLSTQPQSFARKTELQEMRKFPVSDGFEKILLFYFPIENGVDLVRMCTAAAILPSCLIEGFLAESFQLRNAQFFNP